MARDSRIRALAGVEMNWDIVVHPGIRYIFDVPLFHNHHWKLKLSTDGVG